MNKLEQLLIKTLQLLSKGRRVILALSVVVVFITTYILILPAFTLEKDEAAKQGGIDVPGIENVSQDSVEDGDVTTESSDESQVASSQEAVEDTGEVTSDDYDDYNEKEELNSERKTEQAVEETDSLTYDGEDYRVIVEDKNDILPENTEIKVEEISKEEDSDSYQQYFDDSVKAINDDENTPSVTDLKFARFYNIQLVADGEEIKVPDDTVNVKVEYDKELAKYMNVGDSENLRIVHFAENKKTGEIQPKVLNSKDVEVNTDKKDNLTDTTFEAESFSVYAIVYTVDFSYSVDGKTFDYSMEGDSSISLKSLLETLEAIKDDKDTEPNEIDLFMAEIDKVEFTNEELIKIEKVTDDEADWTLTSLKPFDTEEKLTITMKNGEVVEVKVTDAQLKTYAISAKGDKYEIIVTYDDTAEIPEDAELAVREIAADTEEYSENVELANKKIESKSDTEAEADLINNSVQFDISIVSNGSKVEPKDGSTVNVEIKLDQSAFENDDSENAEDSSSDENNGMIMFNGQEISLDEASKNVTTEYNVVHITDEGKVDFIEDVDSTIVDGTVVMQFETESFSDYMVQGANQYNFGPVNNLPNVIYVGDEIYMQGSGNIWVTDIGRVVSETKHNNQDDYKVVRAISPGRFRICSSNNWNNGSTEGTGKIITVLPARTGTTPPRTLTEADGIISNSSIGLTLNLFDYDLDEYLDDRFNNYDFGGNNPATSAFVNHGINNGHALKFWGSGITNGSTYLKYPAGTDHFYQK